MAKKGSTKKSSANNANETTAAETVTVTYDLFDLPTAQHKAGLAGLVLQIEHMQGKSPKPPAIPRIVEVTATSATIEFTEASTRALFDDAYSATKEPSKPAEKPRKKKKSKEVIPWHARKMMTVKNAKGIEREVEGYVYLDTTPKLPFLDQHLGQKQVWMKLWRDMLWAIPRAKPLTRIPFESRAAERPCKEGVDAWKALLKAEKSRRKNQFQVERVAGSLWLGAQDVNAESVPFQGRVEQTLLLHFWPLTTLVYSPRVLKLERKEGRLEASSEFPGYALAIPEIANLSTFRAYYPELLSGLEDRRIGYRPAEAVIDFPEEGALSFLDHFAKLTHAKATGAAKTLSLGSVEYLFSAKVGDNVKTLAAGRVTFNRRLLTEYHRIVGKPGEERTGFRNPLFRRGLLLALFHDEPWFQPFGKLFQEWPVEFFCQSDASPQKLSWFWADAKRKLQEVQSMVKDHREGDPPPEESDLLATLVNQFIRRYLDERLKAENAEWDFVKFRKEKSTPSDAGEARRKLGERLFLELRSRRDEAFIAHFTGTFFRVSQFLGKNFEKVADALYQRTDEVKTLALLALSGNSWVYAKKKETAK